MFLAKLFVMLMRRLIIQTNDLAVSLAVSLQTRAAEALHMLVWKSAINWLQRMKKFQRTGGFLGNFISYDLPKELLVP